MKKTMKSKAIALALAALTAFSAAAMLTGCAQQKADDKTATLYSDRHNVGASPEWVTKLDTAKDAEQLIVVAGYDKNTAYVSMHEKDSDGKWQKIVSAPVPLLSTKRLALPMIPAARWNTPRSTKPTTGRAIQKSLQRACIHQGRS